MRCTWDSFFFLLLYHHLLCPHHYSLAYVFMFNNREMVFAICTRYPFREGTTMTLGIQFWKTRDVYQALLIKEDIMMISKLNWIPFPFDSVQETVSFKRLMFVRTDFCPSTFHPCSSSPLLLLLLFHPFNCLSFPSIIMWLHAREKQIPFLYPLIQFESIRLRILVSLPSIHSLMIMLRSSLIFIIFSSVYALRKEGCFEVERRDMFVKKRNS